MTLLPSALLALALVQEPTPPISGIHAHLALFNQENECGVGAVVPWADRLWVMTYGPHKPFGSSDKLYEITRDLRQIIRPESVGGTHANRMIHRESGQLLLGPYLVDQEGRVRVIPPTRMPGRLTGTARHLTDPARKVFHATMEEGLYEVDVETLAVRALLRDGNRSPADETPANPDRGPRSALPGAHGKGLYQGLGRLVYTNNGEGGARAQGDPTVESGALAEWTGAGDWQLVRRGQFTEVTGPGGLRGNQDPDDPLWSIGFDHRSLILMVCDAEGWQSYRLPKGSHSYDGAHGWNTEWPRIRDVGEDDLLMTMHGTFWRFPRQLRHGRMSGLVPRSSYLKVVGDFCRWDDWIVLGCDDTARSQFLNKRPAHGGIAGPGQSQSNLWFLEPATLDALGPTLGRGAVWLDDPVAAATPSDPFLFAGFERRGVHLAHTEDAPVRFTFEVDARGDGRWQALRTVEVPARGSRWLGFRSEEQGAWVRVTLDRDCNRATALFHVGTRDLRTEQIHADFRSLARCDDTDVIGGLLHARGADHRTLRYLATDAKGERGCYDLDGDLRLHKVEEAGASTWMRERLAIPMDILQADEASLIFEDEGGRWRLPRARPGAPDRTPLGPVRVSREVCTERDLFQAQGTFFELPAENAGGFALVRPIATSDVVAQDFTSWRGFLVLAGLSTEALAQADPHVIVSEDGQVGLWLGAVDDLWRLGKPRGVGGPWMESAITAGEPSDPYLMTGYDRKSVTLSHTANQLVRMTLEVDVSGRGHWHSWRTFDVPNGEVVDFTFPDAFAAYWVRARSDTSTEATVQFHYE